MKSTNFPYGRAALAAVVLACVAGCNRQTRGNDDAANQSRAATPAEGGATATSGSAGESKSFGDTNAKARADGVSPSASPTGLSKDTAANQPAPPVTPPVKQEPQQK
jgi:hypothetical protein